MEEIILFINTHMAARIEEREKKTTERRMTNNFHVEVQKKGSNTKKNTDINSFTQQIA